MPPIAATPLHSDHPSSQNSPNTKTSRPTDYSPPAQTVVSQISSCHKHTVLPPYGTLPSSFHPPQSAASERTDTQIPSAPAHSSSPPTNNSAAQRSYPSKDTAAIRPPPNHYPQDSTSTPLPHLLHIVW